MGGNGVFIINFVVVSLILMGGVIFALHKLFVGNVEGAVRRLDTEAEAARSRQTELERKIAEVEEELKSRKAELNEVEKKIRGQIEEEAIAEKDKIIETARTESEQIIAKAQEAAEKLMVEIEKQMDVKIIDFSSKLLGRVLTDKARGLLNQQLMGEFVDKLKDVDMSRIGNEVKQADLISTEQVPENVKSQISQIMKQKLNREIKLNSSLDDSVVAGLVLQFDSLQLNGSLQDFIREEAIKLKDERFRD